MCIEVKKFYFYFYYNDHFQTSNQNVTLYKNSENSTTDIFSDTLFQEGVKYSLSIIISR